MQKTSASQSGVINPRVLLALTLCSVGALLAMFSLAPTPSALAQVSPEEACVPVPGWNDRCPAWSTQYPPPETLGDGCTEEAAHQVVGTEAVYLTATRSCSGFDILVLAYSFDGDLMWSHIHNGAANRRDHAFNLAVSPDGRHLYVVGSEGTGDTSDWVVIALDGATGEQEWIAHHDGPAHATDEAWLAAVSEDGQRLYVSGFDSHYDAEGQERGDTLTIAYDALTGEERWAIRFDGDPQHLDLPRAIGVRGDRVVITGSSLELLGTQDLQTVVYRDDRDNERPEELWRASYDGGDWDQPAMTCISRQSPSCLGLMGSVVMTDKIVGVAGTSFIDPATDDAVWTTIGYDVLTGERKWLQRFGDPTLQNKANAVAAAPDGQTIYVTGFTNDEELDGVGNAAVVAYDAATGQERWRSNYALTGVEDASGFGLTASEDTVYVSGQVQIWFANGVRSEVLTIAHDAATGKREWIGRHSRTIPVIGNGDRGHWIGLAPDGARLFVGGGFANSFRVEDRNDFWDLGLLAYDIGIRVVSRKVHGSAGTFDVKLPLTGNPGIESRSGGANGDYTLVFTFPNDLIAIGGASASGCGGSISSNANGPNSNQYTVNLTGVSNACSVTVTLSNVVDTTGNLTASVPVTMGVLVGDVNQDGFVLSGDYTAARQKSGTPVDGNTFKYDVNVDGFILSGDYTTVRQQSGAHF